MKKPSEQILAKAYEIGVMKLLKEVAESGDDVHENHTPSEICDMMLDKVNLASAKSILVLYNIELLFSLRKAKYQGHVTFFTQSPKKAELAPKIFGGVNVEYIDKEDNPLYLMENKWPDKFDIVIANPPYSKKLDLKFLDKAFEIAEKDVVFVHPSAMWISKGENKFYLKSINKFGKNLKSLELFNGNGIFGISLYTPIAVTHLSKENSGKLHYKNHLTNEDLYIDEKEILNLSIFGLNERFNSMYEKIKKIDNTCDKHGFIYSSGGNKHNVYLRNPNAFHVSFANVKGNTVKNTEKNIGKADELYKRDFFCFLNTKTKVEHKGNPNYQIWFEFETEVEANNFLKYLKTDFSRFCLSLVKRDQNIKLNTLPWLDFKQEWTDEKLYSHFKIDLEEQAFIKEVILPYYD